MKFRYIIFLLVSLALLLFVGNLVSNSKKELCPVEQTSINENLMLEHGALDRLLLIYDEIIYRIDNQESFPVETLKRSAALVRRFIEDFHEKLEEDYIFSKFKKANMMTDLIQTLEMQHQKGRLLTDSILAYCNASASDQAKNKDELANSLEQFIVMYDPHGARESTVLFPEFKRIISKEEYLSLSKTFDKLETSLFGEKGFGRIIDEIASIEKELGLYDLAQYTDESPANPIPPQ